MLTKVEIENGGEWPSEDAGILAGNVVHDGSTEDNERYGKKQYDETFTCTLQGMKLIGTDDNAGLGCPLWEAGSKRGSSLPPHLVARMAELDAKVDE